MPGSKKGERRGGAKPRIVRKPKSSMGRGFGTGAGRKDGRNKPKPDAVAQKAIGEILNRHITVGQKEKAMEAYLLATGHRMRLPKEVMLTAMRYFEETAIDYGEVLRSNLMLSAAAQTDEARAIYEAAIDAAEMRLREYLTQAVDVAYKVAPFVHPRLAALITNPGSEQNPLNAVAMLFKELDEAGRPPQYIDHDPGEVVK
jgi:hypothetical protein